MNPTVTILLATFNRAHLITETLDSIIAQTYSHWECIIVDDYSTDETANVVKKYVEKDHRFSYYLKTDQYKKGLAGTRNYGLDIASDRNATFIQLFDDDDIMHPRKLELQIEPFIKDSKLNMTICKFESLIEYETENSYIVKNEYQLIISHLGEATLTGALRINSLSTLWRMEIINKFRFDEDLLYAEEWELFTRIGFHYPNNYLIIDEYLFSYRKHSNTLTLGKDLNYNKRKSSAIIRIKIFEYLTKNNLHTQKSILFLAKTFLINSYNPIYVKRLLDYINQNKGFSFKLYIYLKAVLYMAKIYSKVIAKLATWV